MTESNIELRGTCIFTDFSGGKQAGGGCYNFKRSGGVQWAINRTPPIVVIECLCFDMTFLPAMTTDTAPLRLGACFAFLACKKVSMLTSSFGHAFSNTFSDEVH